MIPPHLRRPLLNMLLKRRSWVEQTSAAIAISAGLQCPMYIFVRLIHHVQLPSVYSVTLASVVAAAMWGGFICGFVTATLSALWIDLAYFVPYWIPFVRLEDFVRFATYVGIALVISTLVNLLRSIVRELEETQKETLLQSQARENIVAIIAHDLKNPISAILLNVSLVLRIAEKKNWNENSIPKLKRTARVALNMSQTISDLLSLAEIEFGTFAFKDAEHTPSELATKLIAWKDVARINGDLPQVEIEQLGPDQAMRFDLDQLVRAVGAILDVFYELLTPDQTIHVRIAHVEDRMRVEIEALGSCADAFRSGDFFESYRSGEKGSRVSRLRVSLSKGILASHGGAFEVTQDGDKTRVTLSIPKSAQQMSSENDFRIAG
jgi:K+-sensing histidine kinase KdpD